MFWKKFLSRKFLLAVAVLVIAVVEELSPGAVNIIDWRVAGVILAYIFGEAGYDILKAYIEWSQPKPK